MDNETDFEQYFLDPGATDGLDERVAKMRQRESRYLQQTALVFLTMGILVWGLRGFYDDFSYEFSVDRAPLLMGNTADFGVSSLRHNSFVRLTGITEHRGVAQNAVQGLSLVRREFWYLRLLGSGGVFLEVAAESGIGITTKVDIVGRVVDPQKEAGFTRLLVKYHKSFAAESSGQFRIIQVDRKPGDGRLGYYIAALFVILLLVSNIRTLVLLWRSRNQRRLIGA